MLNLCDKHGFYKGEICPDCPKAQIYDETIILGGCDPGRDNDFFAYVDLKVQNGIASLLSAKTWLHKDYHIVVPEIAERYRQINERLLAVDATGLGEVVVDMFNLQGVVTEDIKFSRYSEYNVFGEPEHAPIKFAMIQWYRYCAQHKKVKLPKVGKNPVTDELITQLKQQERLVGADPEHHPNARVSYGHPSGTKDDIAWSYLMALYIARPWMGGMGGFVVGGPAQVITQPRRDAQGYGTF